MKMKEERQKIVEYGQKLITTGLTSGTGGNISIYNEEEGLIAISPSGIDYFETKIEDVALITLDGEWLEGDKKPSTEVHLHRVFYNNRDDIKAVVHAHSMYSTVLASLGWELPAVNYFIGLVGGNNVRTGEYKPFGTQELAEATLEAMEGRYSAFMGNHGLIAGSDSVEQAFTVASETERMAEIYYKSRLIGDPNILTDQDVDLMLEKFGTYQRLTPKN